MSSDTLTGKKLKIWSKMASGQVLVVQDGNAADGDATIKVDDGFEKGYVPYGAENRVDRIMFNLDALEVNRSGKTLRFRISDHVHVNTLAVGYGDRVQLSLDQGVPDLSPAGAFPSWHAHEQTGQTVHFDGFARSVKRVRNEGGVSEWVVECVDALTWADEVKVMQAVDDGIVIPTIILGDVPQSDSSYFLAIKKITDDPSVSYGFGNPSKTELQMSVGDILDYLEGSYLTDLVARDIAPPSGGIFEASELATLSEIPPKMVFENAGFATVVRQVIKTQYPDFDIRIDPRTRKWHFVPGALDILHTGSTTTIGSQPAANQIVVVDDSLFATSGNGSTLRIISATNPFESEVADVASIDDLSNTITLTSSLAYSYAAGAIVVPMYASANRPPRVSVDLETYSQRNELSVDLSQSWTAVRVVGAQQKSERVEISKTASVGGPQVILAKNWDPAYEGDYNERADSHRRADRGVDGDGILIDEIETFDSPPKTRIYFSMESSAYGTDHMVKAGGDSEWTGNVVLFLTEAGANVESRKIAGKITGFYESGWMDSPTNTIRRYRVELDRNILDDLPNLQDEVNDADGDFVELSMSDVHSPTNPNKRWAVGRSFTLESTTAAEDAQYLTDYKCPPIISYPYAGATYSGLAQPVGRGNGAPRTQAELNAYWGLNPSQDPLRGQAGGFFLPTKPPAPPSNYSGPACRQQTRQVPAFNPIDDMKVEVDRFNLDVHQVRVPADGFSGLAWLFYKHAKELVVSFDDYVSDGQDAQYALVGQSLWSRFSDAKYTGEVELFGVTKWLQLADLGFRVTLGGGGIGGPLGVVTDQSRFWGLVESIRFDLQGLATSFSFDSSGFADDLQENLFERKFLSEENQIREVNLELQRLDAKLECLQRLPTPAPPPSVPACNVAYQGGFGGGKGGGGKTSVKQAGIGTSETQLGSPNGSNSNSASNKGSLSFDAPWLIERDYLGNAGAFLGQHAVWYGGTEVGSRFFPDEDEPLTFVTLPKYNADTADELADALWDIDLDTPEQHIRVEVGSGSTATVIQVVNAMVDDGRFNGGTIEFAENDYEARPSYAISHHSDHSITLSSAMSESVPAEGMTAWVRPKPPPALDATDFPNGGRPFKDSLGNWFVASNGTVTSASLSDNTLTEETGSPNTPTVEPGISGGLHKPRGDWQFNEDSAGNGHYSSDYVMEQLVELGHVLSESTEYWSGLHDAAAMAGGTAGTRNGFEVKVTSATLNTTIAVVTWRVPSWYDGTFSFDISWFSAKSPGSDEVWRLTTDAKFITPSGSGDTPASITQDVESISVLSSYTANDVVTTNVSVSLGSVAAGDLVQFTFARPAETDSADTHSDEVSILDIRPKSAVAST